MAVLAGCSTSTPPATPTPKAVSLEGVGKGLDQIDTAVAASVQVAREMNKAGKPDKVESELSVAAANLPKADDSAVALSRQRAEKATSAEYEAQRKQAQAKAVEMDKAWAALKGQVEDGKRVLREKDDLIRDLNAQLESGKKDIWTITGAGLAVIGGLAWAFASWKMGAPLLLAGAFCGLVPYIVDSPAFYWTSALTFGACAAIGVWWLWDKAKDSINENEEAQKEIQNRRK